MTKGEQLQHVRLHEIEGFQHAQDDYWYRPLIFGKNIFTYVAHIPPGGEMPAHEDAHDFDTSLYMICGSLHITYGINEFEVNKNEALYIPGGVPFGVRNDGDMTASYVLTFNPQPDIESLSALKETYHQKNRDYKTPQEMKDLVGDTLD